MIVEKSVKVRLTKEERECLEEANKIINELDMATRNCDCEIEFEDDTEYLLDEIQATIRSII